MTIKVLIADDHKILRDGLGSLLEDQNGIQVLGEAQNGREAVRKTKELRPDVVLMDVAMPDLNGFEATRLIGGAVPEAKVLALSMHSDSRYVKRMLEAGASGYMLKDCAVEELAAALRTVSAGRIYVSPEASSGLIQDYLQREPDSDSGASELTAREREVLQLIAEGRPTAEIAGRLYISAKTVETHRKHIMDKLGMRSIAELTKFAIRQGITEL